MNLKLTDGPLRNAVILQHRMPTNTPLLFSLPRHIFFYNAPCHHKTFNYIYFQESNALVSYSLYFKIKVTFGQKLRYEIKGTFGEISLKPHQTNWNVAKNNGSVVADELPSQITVLHLFNNWYLDLTATTHINAVLCALVPSAQNGKLPMMLAPKVFNFTKSATPPQTI